MSSWLCTYESVVTRVMLITFNHFRISIISISITIIVIVVVIIINDNVGSRWSGLTVSVIVDE